MKVYCTYCSREKNKTESPIPAINLYDSTRIRKVHALAKSANCAFFILSGKFGWIHSNTLIPYYDHLLVANEVEDHVEKVVGQMKNVEMDEILFYAESVENDPNLKAYYDCIKAAAKRVGVTLSIIHTSN